MAGVRYMAEFFLPCKDTRKLLDNFILNYLSSFALSSESKQSKLPISKATLQLSTKLGGLGLMSLEQELQIIQTKKFHRWLNAPNDYTIFN